MAQAGDLITHIRVINRNPFPIIDRYDGIIYTFNPMEKVTVPADVATHIFGYRPDATEDDMFRHIQRRFGWNSLSMVQTEQDRVYFDNLDIKPVVYVLIERPADEAEGVPVTELTKQEQVDWRKYPRKKRKVTARGKRVLEPRAHAEEEPLGDPPPPLSEQG